MAGPKSAARVVGNLAGHWLLLLGVSLELGLPRFIFAKKPIRGSCSGLRARPTAARAPSYRLLHRTLARKRRAPDDHFQPEIPHEALAEDFRGIHDAPANRDPMCARSARGPESTQVDLLSSVASNRKLGTASSPSSSALACPSGSDFVGGCVRAVRRVELIAGGMPCAVQQAPDGSCHMGFLLLDESVCRYGDDLGRGAMLLAAFGSPSARFATRTPGAPGQVHDYIQWLFPIDEPSRHHHGAPLLTPELRESAVADSDVVASVLAGSYPCRGRGLRALSLRPLSSETFLLQRVERLCLCACAHRLFGTPCRGLNRERGAHGILVDLVWQWDFPHLGRFLV